MDKPTMHQPQGGITTIDGLISMQAKIHPDKIAIKHNGQSISYQHLDIASNQIAAYFIDHQIKRNDIVAVAMDRSIQLVVCLLGIIKAGAAYLPIDPNLPIDRANFLLKDSSAKTLCTSRNNVELYRDNKYKIFFDDAWEKRFGYPTDEIKVERDDSDLAYILYTSGSTGLPKGVAIEHHSLFNLLLSIQKSPGITPDDVMLGITTISFDIAEVEIFLPLISGASVIMVDSEVARDGRALLDIIKTEQISIVQATPFTWRMILQSGWDCLLPVKAFCGGEAMSKDLSQKLLARCKELWNMYGPTETTIYSIIKKITADDAVITIGNAIDNTQIYILDKDQNQVPNGEEGEIYIGGAGVAREYVNRPELTSERFIDDKFSASPGKRIYKTGDWGKFLDNGEVQYLGRIDHQIKVRGYRIETEEIEYQLKQLKGIKEALIVLHEYSEENKQLVAYIVVESKYAIKTKAKEWKESLKKKLPSYMLPAHFIAIPKVPLMPNGKVDRKLLPAPLSNKATHKNIAPKTRTELIIAKIILRNTDFKSIDLNDNFIDIGIDSLIALKIIVDIEEKFDKRLPLTVLAHHPTIKLLSEFINNISVSPYNSLIPIQYGGNKVPLYLVHGIGLNLFNFNGMVSHLDEDQPVYGLRAAGLDGNHEPLESIEEVAAYYNQEILNHDPIGPYAIAGYSFGGVVAFEMVKQMQQAGKKVELLAMIDTNIQLSVQQHNLSGKIRIKARRQLNKLRFRVQSIYQEPLHNISYFTTLYSNEFKRLMTKLGLSKNDQPDLPKYMQVVVNKLEAAMRKYVLKPADIKIELFKAEKRVFYVDDPEFLGWGNLALKGVDTYIVPGDHKEMFNPPYDRVLGKTLQGLLDKVKR